MGVCSVNVIEGWTHSAEFTLAQGIHLSITHHRLILWVWLHASHSAVDLDDSHIHHIPLPSSFSAPFAQQTLR